MTDKQIIDALIGAIAEYQHAIQIERDTRRYWERECRELRNQIAKGGGDE